MLPVRVHLAVSAAGGPNKVLSNMSSAARHHHWEVCSCSMLDHMRIYYCIIQYTVPRKNFGQYGTLF